VGYNKYPSDVPKDEDKKWVIDGGRDAAVAKVDGKLGNQEEIRLSGNPGIAFGFSFTVDGSHVKAFARIYFANASLYRLLVYVADGKDHADDVKRFFDSFVLLGNQG
jgi:hypothetical protein